jgi:MoxR-like ATPase
MEFPYYSGKAKKQADPPAQLPAHALRDVDAWDGYEAEPALEKAVNVALLLGQPLLLTGDPGTGKTQLAFHLSKQLGWGDPFIFEAKSTSTYRDLFYTYDALGRFHAKSIGGKVPEAVDFIEYNALGKAILRTRDRDSIKDYLREQAVHDGPRHSVVLIDEIDKAPRDFPNDILREIETLYFKVPEVNSKAIEADKRVRPVVVITSNSEKSLPPAFLRRCTFHHIKPPSDEKLQDILKSRIGELADSDPFYRDAVALYNRLRGAGLEKQPGTAELIAFVAYLRTRGVASLRKAEHREDVRSALSALVKSDADGKKSSEALDKFLASQPA